MIRKTQEQVRPSAQNAREETVLAEGWQRAAYWSFGSVGTAVIQGLCVFCGCRCADSSATRDHQCCDSVRKLVHPFGRSPADAALR